MKFDNYIRRYFIISIELILVLTISIQSIETHIYYYYITHSLIMLIDYRLVIINKLFQMSCLIINGLIM